MCITVCLVFERLDNRLLKFLMPNMTKQQNEIFPFVAVFKANLTLITFPLQFKFQVYPMKFQIFLPEPEYPYPCTKTTLNQNKNVECQPKILPKDRKQYKGIHMPQYAYAYDIVWRLCHFPCLLGNAPSLVPYQYCNRWCA